jgi:prolyl-tRNA synthetase
MADGTQERFNVSKANDFNKWYETILPVAGIMDKRYPVKGMPIFTTYGYHVHCRIMEILEKEWAKQKIDKVQFPILIPKTFLERETKHLAGFSPEVFWVTKGGDKDLEAPAALRPTSETAMYSMFSEWVRSFRDLPLKIHQTCTVYRYETKVRCCLFVSFFFCFFLERSFWSPTAHGDLGFCAVMHNKCSKNSV